MPRTHARPENPSATVSELAVRLGIAAVSVGAKSLKVKPSTHLSRQKRVRRPLPIMTEIEASKKALTSAATLIGRPDQTRLSSVRLQCNARKLEVGHTKPTKLGRPSRPPPAKRLGFFREPTLIAARPKKIPTDLVNLRYDPSWQLVGHHSEHRQSHQHGLDPHKPPTSRHKGTMAYR